MKLTTNGERGTGTIYFVREKFDFSIVLGWAGFLFRGCGTWEYTL